MTTPEPTRTMQEIVVACVRRELKLRETCYPRWVKSGRMKAKVADYELTAMRDVLTQLERIPGLEFDLKAISDRLGGLEEWPHWPRTRMVQNMAPGALTDPRMHPDDPVPLEGSLQTSLRVGIKIRHPAFKARAWPAAKEKLDALMAKLLNVIEGDPR